MKNTFKRFLALVMVLCTVAAWMIPGVSADEPENKDLVVNTTEDFTALGLTASGALNAATINAAYDAGTIKWGIHTTDTKGLRTRAMSGEVWLQHQQYSYTSNHSSVALKFIAPADGKYTFSVDNRYYYKERAFTSMDIFIIESPETPLTANNGTLRSTVRTLRAEDAAILTHGSGSKTFTSEKTVNLYGGQEYLLILGAVGETPGDTYYYGYINGFALHYQAPLDVYDYTLNYHANYEGAENVTVTDTLSSTKTALEMVVGASSLNRDGYRLAGWATEPTGEIVYNVGDKIALTSASTVADLYAVWKPQSSSSFYLTFSNMDSVFGLAQGDYLATGRVLNANGQIIMDKYNNGESIWAPYTVQNNYGSSIRYTSSGLTTGSRNLTAGSINRGGVVLLLRAPVSGKFTVSSKIVARPGDDVADSVEIHIMPKPNYALDGYDERYTLQNFITSRKSFTDADGNSFTFNEADAVINAAVQDPTMTDSNLVKDVVGQEYTFEEGKEYIIVIAACETDESIARRQAEIDEAGLNQDGKTKPTATVDIINMSFKPALPAVATVGATEYDSVEKAAAAAAPGETIKMIRNATATNVNLPEGVILNLNGCTLTAGAVVGTIMDSKDGNGRVATNSDAVISTPEGTLALWDDTTGATGFRIFNYTFENVTNENGASQDSSVTTDADATTIAVFGGNTEHVSATAATWFDNYVAGTINWRYEYCSNPYYAYNGSYMDKSYESLVMRSHTGNNMAIHAIRFRSPGAGLADFTLTYGIYRGAEKADIYIIPASVVDSLLGDDLAAAQKALTAAIVGNATKDNAHYSAVNAAIKAAIAETTPVIDDLCYNTATSGKDKTATGTYTFGDEAEYLMVFVPVEANASDYSYMLVDSLTFDPVPVTKNIRTFWSHLKFSNPLAYTLVASGDTGLQAGFMMNWNNQEMDADFRFDGATIVEWAKYEEANAGTDYGFFIRVGGFEAVGEGILTAKPYIKVGTKTIYTSGAMTYTTPGYVAPDAAE